MASGSSPAADPPRPEVMAFLSYIKENPDEDAPRLVLADWLEERGDPRGEFIRLQCWGGRARRPNWKRAKRFCWSSIEPSG